MNKNNNNNNKGAFIMILQIIMNLTFIIPNKILRILLVLKVYLNRTEYNNETFCTRSIQWIL